MLLFLALGVLAYALPAQADLKWLTETDDCKTFHIGVSKYFGSLGELSQLSEQQKKEISLVINEACGPRFAQCQFQICKSRGKTSDADTASPDPKEISRPVQEPAVEPKTSVPAEVAISSSASEVEVAEPEPQLEYTLPESAATSPAPSPEPTIVAAPSESTEVVSNTASAPSSLSGADEDTLNEELVATSASERSSSSEENLAGKPGIEVTAQSPPIKVKQPFTTDPLAWLEREMECDEFLEQIRVRYEPLGKFSELPEAKKSELRTVLGLVCSPRFKHCNYPSCASKPAQKSASGVDASSAKGTTTGPSKEEVALAIQERAEKIQRAYLADRAALREQIAEKVAEEKKKKLEWERFSIQSEVEARKPEERELTRSPAFESKPYSKGGPEGASPGHPGNYGKGGNAPNSGKSSREYSEPKRSPYGRSGSSENQRLSDPDEPVVERPQTKNIPIPAPGNYTPKPLGF